MKFGATKAILLCAALAVGGLAAMPTASAACNTVNDCVNGLTRVAVNLAFETLEDNTDNVCMAVYGYPDCV